MATAKRVLIIDRDEQSRAELKQFFNQNESHSFIIEDVMSAKTGLEKCRDQDLIILMSSVEDLSFADFIKNFQALKLAAPIIFIGKSKEEEKMIEALNLGARDALFWDVLSKKYFTHRINQIIEKDILEKKVHRQANQLEEMASVDALTLLPTREHCMQALKQAIAQAQRNNRIFALLVFNIDNFRSINENYSFEIGNGVLREFAVRLKRVARVEDVVVRLWGDEFAVILTEIKEVFDAGKVAKKIMQEIGKPFLVGTNEIIVSASGGVSCFPMAGLDPTILLKNASTAMHRVKHEGGNQCQFFQSDVQDHYMQRVMLENEMLFALERNEIFLRYQPKIDLQSGEITGIEAFIRWAHPTLGEIGPDKFIKIAENNGQIVPMGNWVIDEACKQLQSWLPSMSGSVRLCLNLSMRQLEYDRLPEVIGKALQKYSLSSAQLEVDISEMALSSQSTTVQNNLKQLHDMGIYIIIENFGTGLIGFRNLKNASFSALKIDRSFIKNLDTNVNDAAVVRSLISLGNGLGVSVIAEGVEEQSQKEFLLKNHCTQAQGFLFAKPLDAAEMQKLLEQSKKT